MTNEATINKMKEMRLSAMSEALRIQLNDPSLLNLTFEERLSLLVDAEYTSRRNNKLYRLIRRANFDQSNATIADINYSAGRQLNKDLINQLSSCQYITDASNIIIMGASGAGKSYLACAFGMAACKNFFTVKYMRLPELLTDLTIARGEGLYKKVIKFYSKVDLLIIDEWMLVKLTENEARDVLEIIHARHKKASTIFCSQFSPAGWHSKINETTLADAILDRIVYDSYPIEIKGGERDQSMREVYGIKGIN